MEPASPSIGDYIKRGFQTIYKALKNYTPSADIQQTELKLIEADDLLKETGKAVSEVVKEFEEEDGSKPYEELKDELESKLDDLKENHPLWYALMVCGAGYLVDNSLSGSHNINDSVKISGDVSLSGDRQKCSITIELKLP